MAGRHRLTRFMAARLFQVRAVGAWRRLLPDWTPTASDLNELEHRSHEHGVAVRFLTYGWSYDDARWDVLLALLEWERRAERERRETADELTRLGQEMDYSNVVSMDQEYERLRYDSEITTETPLPERCKWCEEGEYEHCFLHKPEEEQPQLVLVPKDPPRVFTVRTLKSIREEQERG